MSPHWRRFIGLCLPPIALGTVDAWLTLSGQSSDYWSGNYGHVNEMSPTWHQLLTHHPLAFVAGMVVWVCIFCGLILILPQTLALATSIAVTFGHMVGSATWLLRRVDYGYQACNGMVLLTAIALAIGIRWGWQAAPAEDRSREPGWLRILRWVIIVALFATIVYLYLWPRTF